MSTATPRPRVLSARYALDDHADTSPEALAEVPRALRALSYVVGFALDTFGHSLQTDDAGVPGVYGYAGEARRNAAAALLRYADALDRCATPESVKESFPVLVTSQFDGPGYGPGPLAHPDPGSLDAMTEALATIAAHVAAYHAEPETAQ